MSVGQICSALARDPVEGGFLLAQRVVPNLLLNRLESLSEHQGLQQPTFLLSFDCDTDRDIEISWDVHSRLVDLGICASYAVPGEIIARGHDAWSRIANAGAEFLNHGYREHTQYRDGKYVSTLFYEHMTAEEVKEDIVRGHSAVTELTGREPVGFRTPHFGGFRSEQQLKMLHATLGQLGYRFSSSAVPYVALRYGPFTKHFGLTEIAVTGCPSFPMTILDSYTFRFTPGRFTPTDYVKQAREWARLMSEGRKLFVNLYADPSQVADWDEFFVAMKHLAPFSVRSFDEVLGRLRQ